LAECKAQAPEILRSYLSISSEPQFQLPPDIPAHVKAEGGVLWCPHFADITAADVAYAQSLDLGVVVWTVNQTVDIDRMIDFGVDAICSDYPARVQRRLSDRGLRWQ
jgi:glycerophosphoryl diester phosphodiesterase